MVGAFRFAIRRIIGVGNFSFAFADARGVDVRDGVDGAGDAGAFKDREEDCCRRVPAARDGVPLAARGGGPFFGAGDAVDNWLVRPCAPRPVVSFGAGDAGAFNDREEDCCRRVRAARDGVPLAARGGGFFG